MSFFDDVEPEPDRLPDPVAPVYKAFAPKTSILPSRLLYDRIIARSQSVCVAISSFECWPENITLTVSIYLRVKPSTDDELKFFGGAVGASGEVFDTPGPRLAILFSDGRYATNVRPAGYPRPRNRGLSTAFPVLTPQGAGGSGGGTPEQGLWRFTQQLDVWPVPPSGAVTVLFDWLDQEIQEVRYQMDGDEIRQACARATAVWS